MNTFFAALVQGIALIQGILVPRLLGPKAVGLFALAMGGVAVGQALKEFGIAEKLVQERDVDLHTSYGVAFTLELTLAVTFFLVVLGVAPLLAGLYHRPELWLLTSVLGLQLFTTAFLELPSAIPYRELRFVRRGVLQSIGPVVAFAVTLPLAFAGLGVWSLAIGSLAGFASAVVVMFVVRPVRPRLTWHRSLVYRYLRFGWPLWLGMVVTTAAGWGSVFVVSATIGVAGLGYFQLAHGWAQRSLVVHVILADAIYPTLVTIQSSTARLRRAFVVSNQLAMLFSATAGLGFVVFATPVVHQLLGDAWLPAVPLVRAQGIAMVLGSVGFNWDTFLAAAGNTKPQLVVSVVGSAWVVGVALPLLAIFGIPGGALAIVVAAGLSNLVRQHYITRSLGRISFVAMVWRQVAGATVVASLIEVLQVLGWRPSSLMAFVAQGVLFVAGCVAAAFVTTRGPLLEVWAVLLSNRRAAATEAPSIEPARGAASLAKGADAAAPWRLHPTPHGDAFPLGVAVDDDDGAVWVTTRDWPALGRLDATTNEWRWTALEPFPHIPTPDGSGGCWAALTRSSAVTHLDRHGKVRHVPVGRSRELLATTIVGGRLWVVDGDRRGLWRLVDDEAEWLPLPEIFRRPDIAIAGEGDTMLVADTSTPVLGVVDVRTGSLIETVPLPHATRWVVADPGAAGGPPGYWLGASGQPRLTRLSADLVVVAEIEVASAPFGMVALGDGRVVACIKEAGHLVVADIDGRTVRVAVPLGSMPMGIACGAGRAWVTLAGSSAVAEVDLAVFDVALPSLISGNSVPIP